MYKTLRFILGDLVSLGIGYSESSLTTYPHRIFSLNFIHGIFVMCKY